MAWIHGEERRLQNRNWTIHLFFSLNIRKHHQPWHQYCILITDPPVSASMECSPLLWVPPPVFKERRVKPTEIQADFKACPAHLGWEQSVWATALLTQWGCLRQLHQVQQKGKLADLGFKK
eukprot:s686_g13.t1